MVPAGLTITAILTDAATVVGEFDTLIVMVVGLAIGFGVVGYIISKAKAARRG